MIGDHQQVYKRYSTQVMRNNILLLKQKETISNQNQQDQIQPQKEQSPFKDNIIFRNPNQKNLEPLVLKRFEEYFKKSIENTKNSRVFNQFIQHQTVKTDKKRRVQKIFTYTSANITSIIETENNLDRKRFIKQRKNKNHSSISKYENGGLQIDEKQKSLILDQNFTDPNLSDVKLKPLNLVTQRSRKRQRLNHSIDLSKLINKTLTENNKKIENDLSTLVSKMQEVDAQNQDYLKIQSSVLVDRKSISSLLKSPQAKKNINQEEIRRSIRKKIENRNQVFEQIYKDKVRSRSPSPSKISRKINFLDFINPFKKQQFTLMDVIKVSLVNSMIDDVKFHMNGCFFSVYVQQGNNGDLIKSIVRGTNGWRVSELIEVSNLVWTQNFRKNLSDKKPKKIFKQPIQQDQNLKRRGKQRSNSDFKDIQDFLLSRVFLRKNSGSNKSLKRKSLQKITNIQFKHKISEDISGNNYTELSLLKHRTQFQQLSYQSELHKLLPKQFKFQHFILRSEKDAKKITINPNLLIHNHLIGHRAISDKKNLLFNLRKFYFSQKINPFQYIPQSHDIFTQDDQFVFKQNTNFVSSKQQNQVMKKETWIVKPGEDSNRGRGIVICKGWESVMTEIGKRFKECNSRKKQISNSVKQINDSSNEKLNFQRQNLPNRSIILQRYIMPLLYQGRKFDIRSYMLVTWVNNVLNGYFYEQCYIRTSSKPFDIDSQNKYVHLTNDAVQSLSHDYGKYEEGNKVSEIVFSKYFDSLSSQKIKSWDNIKVEMSQRCKDILMSSSKKLVGRFRHLTQNSARQGYGFSKENSFLKIKQTQRSQNTTSQKGSFLFPNNQSKQQQISFELFGLDFMIDQNLKLWLIQVNTNPAITHDCSRVLNRLIPKLLDNTFAIAVMPFMRPSKISENIQYQNKYHHIYQEKIDF